MARSLPREVAELAFDLGLHVERLLTARDAAGVARLDQLADLVGYPGIGRGGRPGERPQLLLDVDGRLAAGGAAGVARLEHLADLVVALGEVHRPGARRAAGPRVAV